MSGVSTPETEALTTGKRGSRLVKVGLVLLVLVVLLVGGVLVAGPSIGASVAKSAIARTTDDGMTVTVDSVSLSWGGPQRVTGVNVHTPDGHDAKIDAALDASLFSLILSRGKGDLGTATVSGKATVNADALKPTETDDAPTDLPPDWSVGEKKAIELGSKFAVALEIERLDLQVVSAVSPTIEGTLTGSARAKAGEATTLKGELSMTPKGGTAGTVSIDASVDGLIPASGVVSTSGLAANGSVTVTNLATSLLTLVQRGPGLPGVPTDLDLVLALGPTIDAEVNATGSGEDVQTDATVRTAQLNVSSHTKLASGRLTPKGVNVVSIKTANLPSAWPTLAKSLEAQGIDLTASPEITITLDSLDWPAGADLRTARAAATLGIGRAGARLPAGALGDSPASVSLAPTTIALAFDSGAVTVKGGVTSMVNGDPAGSLDLDLRADNALNSSGGWSLTSASALLATPLSGTATLTDAPSALLQPLLGPGSPIELTRDVGPRVSASLEAQSAPGQPTVVSINANATNLDAQGAFTMDGSLVQNEPTSPTRVTINTLSPTLAGLLGDAPPATLTRDGGLVVSVDTLRLDLDKLKQGGLFGNGTLNLRGDYRLAPVSATVAAFEQPISTKAIGGTFSIQGPTITTSSPIGSVALGDQADAISGVTLESTTTMPDRTSDAKPTTSAKLVASRISTKALGEWMGADAGAGKTLAALDDVLKLEAEPRVMPDGVVTLPFAIDGTGLDLTGLLSPAAGAMTGQITLDVTDTSTIDKAMGLASGLAGELLGPSVEVRLNLLPAVVGENTPEPASGVINAEVSVASTRVETQKPIRVVSSSQSISVPEPFTVRAQLTPKAYQLLSTKKGEPAAAAAPGTLALARATDLTATVNAFTLPKAAGATLSMDASVRTGPLALQRVGEAAREFSGLTASVKNVEGMPSDLWLLASLDESGRSVMRADVMATGAINDANAFSVATAGFTGTVKLDQAPTELLDLLAGSNVLANLLGPATDADLRLASFPRDGGTMDGTVTGARASGSIHAKSANGTISLAQPAVFELREITQAFSYQFTPLLPVVGALTKSPTADRPATVTVRSLSMPVKFDLAALGFDASIDVGTASIVAENDLTAMLRGRPSIGNRFAPFNAAMTGGVLKVTGLTVPLGEFMVPASGTYNLASKSEDVRVQLPAAALLAEAIGGGKQDVIGSVLGNLVNVSLHKSGALGAKNAWKVETTSPLDGGKPSDEQIRKGINDLLNIFGR